jgi:hypothetical protein
VTAVAVDGVTRIRYRIDAVNPPPAKPAGAWTHPPVPNAEATLYYTLTEVRTGAPYCAESKHWFDDHPFPSDRSKKGIQAVPVAEVWNLKGTQGRNADHFTMACMRGAIAKCYRWGFQGWNPVPANAKARVQACTRMAMADYCGDGRSHTVEGTPIDHDTVERAIAGQIPDLADVGPWFETAWTGTAKGGSLPELPDWNGDERIGGALCLSKKRWDTIPLASGLGGCPRLPDPRVQTRPWPTKDGPKVQTFNGEYCDYRAHGSVDYQELQDHGALLFNASPFLDAQLSLWTHATRGTHLTTSHLIDPGPRPHANGPPLDVVALDPLDADLGQQMARSPLPVGSVFTRRELPHSIADEIGQAAAKLVALRLYVGPRGSFITTTRNLDRPILGVEGWIYGCKAPPPADSKGLHRVRVQGEDITGTPELAPPGAQAQGAPAPDAPCPRGLEGRLPVFGRCR